jgi:hypothetical protein
MIKQECLDPHQEDYPQDDWEDLKKKLEEGSEEDSAEEDSHPNENEDDNSFVSDSATHTEVLGSIPAFHNCSQQICPSEGQTVQPH